MGTSGEAALPDAMNWHGKMNIPKSWYDEPVSKLTARAAAPPESRPGGAAPDAPRRYAIKTYNERHPELNEVLRLNQDQHYLAKYYQALGESEKIRDVIERGDKLDILEGFPQEWRDKDLQLPRF